MNCKKLVKKLFVFILPIAGNYLALLVICMFPLARKNNWSTRNQDPVAKARPGLISSSDLVAHRIDMAGNEEILLHLRRGFVMYE